MSDSLRPYMDCSPPSSSIHGIFQAKVLEWIAMPSSRGSSRITNIRVEINDWETKKTIEKIKETKSWFFERTDKTEKPLTRLTNKKQISKIRNETDILYLIHKIQRTIKDYEKQIYNKLDNLKEMDTFLETYHLWIQRNRKSEQTRF